MSIKVVSRKQIPTNSPLLISVVGFLALERFESPEWLWGASAVVLGFFWIVFFYLFYTEEPTELKELK